MYSTKHDVCSCSHKERTPTISNNKTIKDYQKAIGNVMIELTISK